MHARRRVVHTPRCFAWCRSDAWQKLSYRHCDSKCSPCNIAQHDPLRQAYIVRNVGSGGSKDICLENLVISNGGEPLIEDASLMLSFGRRYGLIGRNGQGKTTLLRAIANRNVAGLGKNTQASIHPLPSERPPYHRHTSP